MMVLMVAIGAAFGAPLRYAVDRAVQAQHETRFPWGTFTVNVIASLVLGVVVGLSSLSPTVTALVGTGFCGALSTYSTFSFETLRLAQDGSRLIAAANLFGSVAAGLLAATAGLLLGHAIG